MNSGWHSAKPAARYHIQTHRSCLYGDLAKYGSHWSGFQRCCVISSSWCRRQNSPNSTTISGDLDQLRTVIETIKSSNPDVLARELKVDMAYHSSHMKGLASKYMTLMDEELTSQGLTRSEPRVPLYSSVFDEVIQVSMGLDAQYWASNLTSPVFFHPAVARRLRDQPQNIFLEVGPHATLAGPLRQICAETRVSSTHGQLYQNGVRANFMDLIPRGKVVSDLPAYAWDHSAQFWTESRISRDWRFRPHGHHAILGQRIPETSGLTPTWRVVLDLEDEPWLYDHKVRDDIVFPFAGYVSMAGEAVRQITGVESAYSVRHVVAHTALVLSESKPVEVVTTLRQHKLTDSNESDSYEFVISSYSGSTWIKHCEGRVKPKTKSIPAPPKWEELPRKTSVSRWYDALARVGLVYGPEFQGIIDVSASAVEPLAAGIITNPDLHQMGHSFFTRLPLILAVPTLMEEVDISRSAGRMEARAWTSKDGKEMGLDVLGDGEIVMRLRGARLTPLEDVQASYVQASSNTDRHAGARLEWFPDFDFMDVHPLFVPPAAKIDGKRVLEELALLCLLDSADRVQNLQTEIPHFAKFREWLNREKYHSATGQHAVIQDSIRYTELSHEQRWDQIRDRMATLSTMPSVSEVAKGLLRICENTEKLFAGEVETIEILTEDNVLTEIYNAVSYGFGSFVRMLAISKPTLRVLEVGAGTGGTTELILRDLESLGGNPCYSVYTFTDISAGFFPQARERFAYAPNMEYKSFDISANPFDQGFEPETYDLILANNVVHATPSLNATLLNLQPLLRPGGHLVLSEVCAVARAPGYIFGNFSGWWLGEPDNRKWEPYVQPDRWDIELKAAGFTGTDTVVYDAEAPYQYCAVIVSQRVQLSVDRGSAITLLCSEPEKGVSQKLLADLQKAGFVVSVSRIGEPICQDQDILSTLDLESQFFDNISETNLGAFQSLLRSIRPQKQKLLWLMPHSQLRCDDPRSAQTIGTFRVARAELAASLSTLEIHPSEPEFSDLAIKVFNKVRSHDDVENLLPDREFAVENGVIKIGRYQPFSLEQEVVRRSKADTGLAKRLEIGKPGLLETLQWVEGALPKQLGDHEVEVHTRAVGMNFRNIMVAMGVLSFGPKSVPLGVELSGVVSRAGSKVTNVTVGDRVCAIAVEGCFSTHALLVDLLVHKIPDQLSFEEAATMVACYTTVFQALMDSVLIHSAAGGIGHCAIRLCQLVGAESFVTKPDFFHSRDDTFLPGVMSETGGWGVDIVLNSLSGELLHASWKCVAEFDKLIELGKRDLVGFGQLNMEPFLGQQVVLLRGSRPCYERASRISRKGDGAVDLDGARELVFLSRSAGKSESDQASFAELNTMGCKVTGVAGRAEVSEDIERAISSAGKPIKGVVHLAMVLRDGPLVDLTYEEWNDAVAPKVQGAWNLHHAFKNRTALDFFVMTSSLVTLVDQPGQGNYAAANTFLESFTQYRHKQGLPASVLGICPIDDIGFVAEIPALRKKLKAQGLFFLPERELLDYMHLAILNSHPPAASQETAADPTQSWASSGYIIMGLRAETHLEDPNCQLFLGRAVDEPALLLEKANTDYLAEEIGRRIFRFMMKPEEDLELGLSLPQIGMDSLMAIELWRWWEQAFGLDISVLEIMGAGTLEELGKVAGQALHAKYKGVEKK
ncbi:polyketide synthase dehydratase-domain-containing protein [Aspergillus ambiguus]|uniref:polyketide synthase dehydratase-domain-containing protein n=1 Tax=Aspergillus ambiguus TaxID=176160 RepID=UPI003CCCD3D1